MVITFYKLHRLGNRLSLIVNNRTSFIFYNDICFSMFLRNRRNFHTGRQFPKKLEIDFAERDFKTDASKVLL